MFKNRTALVVEDDAHNLFAITSLLKAMQIQYKRNTTGAKVVQQARTLTPDFILLDMDLPSGDPFLICELLHADPSLQGIPIIAIADSHLLKHLLPRIKVSAFSGFIPKPFSKRDFESILASVLDGERV